MLHDHLAVDISNSPMWSYTNGIMGAIASSLAVITSFQEQLDWWVRFSGSVILLAISAVSLYNMVHQLIMRWRNKRTQQP
jgi:hypothetical protein